MARVTLEFRPDELTRKLRGNLMLPDGIVRKDAQRRARNVRNKSRELARTRSRGSTGRLPRSIQYTTAVEIGSDRVLAQVGSNLPHAIWTEQGTGIYGPHHTPIVPRTHKYMKFRSNTIASSRSRPHRRFSLANPTQGRLFLLPRVKGQPAKHYLRDAMPAARD